MKRKLLLAAALFSLPMMFAVAAPNAAKPLEEGKPYAEQRQRILSDLEKGELYSEIGTEKRRQVVDALGRIDQRLGDGGMAALPDQERIAIFNDQELVNNLLTEAREDSRLVCRRERPIGSNRPQNYCMTVAQRRQARENGVDMMRNMPVSQSKVENP